MVEGNGQEKSRTKFMTRETDVYLVLSTYVNFISSSQTCEQGGDVPIL